MRKYFAGLVTFLVLISSASYFHFLQPFHGESSEIRDRKDAVLDEVTHRTKLETNAEYPVPVIQLQKLLANSYGFDSENPDLNLIKADSVSYRQNESLDKSQIGTLRHRLNSLKALTE